MQKGDLAIDSRGLIREAYRIEGIGLADCRTIFLDWVLGLPEGTDQIAAIHEVSGHYAAGDPDHPMSQVLREGLAGDATARRRGGRAARRG